MTNVYYFNEPVIGYCRRCDITAIYVGEYGLFCPECKTKDLTIFVWDNESPHPESDTYNDE